jgi:predicted PurR-regulated permease PerM
MRRSVSVPGLVTILAALIGVSLLGFVGGLLAVPIAAAILLIIDEVVLPRADAS